MRDWNSSMIGVLVGGLTGTALGLGGFWLAEIPGTHAMGLVMFVLVPFATGFAIAMVTQEANRATAAGLLTAIVCLSVLVYSGIESFLCVLTLSPLLFVALGVGIALGVLFRKLMNRVGDKSVTFTSVVLLSMPLVILAGHRVEVDTLVHSRREIVTSTIRLAAEPNEVWTALRSFDSIKADKPFLMHVGLPIPIRCAMQGNGLGAKRTCYFDQGYIEETVTDWSPPDLMSLSIDRTNMPGRHWLNFENAEYELRRDNGETVLTRTTTITSNLYPVWYWHPFERWGVASEHEYIFGDLARRFPAPR